MDRSLWDIATDYVRRGWSVTPIPYRSKNPERSGWRQLRLTEADIPLYFARGRWNIGVLLGEPSGWLVDVDLDHDLALTLADEYLPSTDAIFGRASKTRSHYLYIVSRPVDTRQWRLPDRRMVAELRSTGCQTVFPCSTHPNGELIAWERYGEPAIVEPDVLQTSLNLLYGEVCTRLDVKREDQRRDRRDASLAPLSVIRRARHYLAKLPPAVSGQGGHDATFRAACIVVIGFGLDRDQSLAILNEWNERCQPPWTDKELEHKVDDALRQPGWRGYLLARSGNSTQRIQSSGMTAIARATRHALAHRRKALQGTWG